MNERREHACNRSSSWIWFWTCVLLACGPVVTASQEDHTELDYHRDIRPILSNHCFRCHGPDAAVREADLRLDALEELLAATDDRAIIVPGDPAASLLVQRIKAPDADDRMPPPHSGLELDDEQVRLLERWIELGAPWERHWSFLPPRRSEVPRVTATAWPRDPIDHHVLARLEAASLSPEPEADRAILLRRVTFDLTGLPPTIAELDAFLTDTEPGAYQRVVDRLLASPRYGEHMAKHWLDLARYADSYGYQSDVHRSVWPYRDWVISALNDNLPYDQFVQWQLAGDLQPEPTREQRIATAFNRLHRQTNEGGSVEEEFRVEYVSDRVHTFGTAMLGLTLECARCHDHKFDPISQVEYYQLSAFFDDIEESGLYSHFTNAVPTPTLLLSTPEQDARIADLRARIATAERELETVRASRSKAFAEWLQDAPADPGVPGCVGNYPLDGIDAAGLRNLVEGGKPATHAGSPVPVEGTRISADTVNAGALLLDGENNLRFPGVAEYRRTDPFTISLRIKVPERFDRAVVLHRTRSWTDAGSQGYELLISDGRLRWSLIHFWPGNAISIEQTRPLEPGSWIHVVCSSDGSVRADGLRLHVDGEEADVSVVQDNLYKPITGGGPGAMTIGQRFRDRGFKGGSVDQLQVFDRVLTPGEIRELHVPGTLAELRARTPETLLGYYLANHDPETAAAREKLQALREQLASTLDGIPELMTMERRTRDRRTYLLERGRYDQRREEVQAGTPSALAQMGASLPRDRLGLARWTTDPGNPLTARVAVNRAWMQLLGTGLVETQEDFGSQGLTPSHPALLDMLALDFIASGWDGKALIRRIVLSATYRQASSASPDKLERDPGNALLSRGPGRRLDAEMMRDHALAASGLLVEVIGGPSVHPYQPAGLWQEKSGRTYPQGTGDALHRRSLYTFWKRTSPPPSMLIFDAAGREVCIARRSSTSTPLQALVLLNDPQYVEAAHVLAERAIEAHPTTDARITHAYRLLTSRHPSQEELEILRALHEEERDALANDDEAAAELGALMIVCSTIMNSDASVTRR